MRFRPRSKPTGPPPAPTLSFGSWGEIKLGEVISVCHPEWRGVRVAAYSHGNPVIEVRDASAAADDLAGHMAEAGVNTLVVHGFPPGAGALLEAAAARGIATRCVLHSSMAQHGADPVEAEVADEVVALSRAGVLERVGFVKQGLAEAFTALGIEAVFVPNRVPKLPEFTPLEFDGGLLEVGVFAEPFWRKNIPTQLGAVAILGEARAHVMRKPMPAYLEVLPIIEHGELPWEEFVALQGSMGLNLYVTLSECQPMSPLESYAAGVPCLFSRTSALFRDDPELWAVSTVGEADDPYAIAIAARRLLAEAGEVVPRAQAWMDRWDEAAARAWRTFVGH